MKTIKKLIKQSKKLDGKTKVKVQLQIPLKKLRANSKLLASIGASKIKILGGKDTDDSKAKTGSEKPAKRTSQPKRAASKGESKAAAGASAKPRTAARNKAPAKSTRAGSVTQAAVLAAMRAGGNTSQTIAAVVKASPAQVSRALSRYTRQGLIVRTAPGQYALKAS